MIDPSSLPEEAVEASGFRDILSGSFAGEEDRIARMGLASFLDALGCDWRHEQVYRRLVSPWVRTEGAPDES